MSKHSSLPLAGAVSTGAPEEPPLATICVHIFRSGGAAPPPDNATSLVTCKGAVPLTFTETVIVGKLTRRPGRSRC